MGFNSAFKGLMKICKHILDKTGTDNVSLHDIYVTIREDKFRFIWAMHSGIWVGDF
jgi:hypothetical protein